MAAQDPNLITSPWFPQLDCPVPAATGKQGLAAQGNRAQFRGLPSAAFSITNFRPGPGIQQEDISIALIVLTSCLQIGIADGRERHSPA
jgi:hypothetical protein